MNTKTDGEMVAWVDEDERLIQVIPRTLANSDPKYLHPEIAVLVFDDQKRVLLQQRALTKKVAPGVWAVTAGHVTYGDSLEQTAHKELIEEMGFDIPTLIPTYRERVSMTNETHFCHWFLGKYNGKPIVIDRSEVEAYCWVGPGELASFKSSHDLSARTEREMQWLWDGKWDKLLK